MDTSRTIGGRGGAVGRALGALLAALALGVAACGGDDEETAAAPKPAAPAAQSGVPQGAKAAPSLQEAQGAKGRVTFCTSKDSSGALTQALKDFNGQVRAQGLSARKLEFAAATNESREQFIQRQQARSPECDVFYSDDIWTAEFAQQRWVMDVTQYLSGREAEFVPSTVATVKYQGRAWGVPKNTDAGFLYYRTDQVTTPPQTWQEVYAQARERDGIVYQGKAYEGLTVDFLELAFAAKGDVLSPDGKKSVINSPQNVRALQFMVDGIKTGAAPRAVLTYEEEEARRSFETGRATFMRNWPYAYALGNEAPKVKGKFAVAPLPAFEGGGKAGIIGGQSLVISSYSRNPAGALRLVDFMTSAPVSRQDAAKFALAPVLTKTYEDPGVQKALPFHAELKQAVEQGRVRPITPVYPQVSQAIYKNVNDALAGEATPQEALKRADEQINQALATF